MIKALVVNLDKDVDKWHQTRDNFSKCQIIDMERQPGVLADDVDPSKISKECSKLCTKSIIGCAAAHMAIWERLINDQHNDMYLVLEDDVYPNDNFDDNLLKVLQNIPPDTDILLLGCFGACGTKSKSVIQKLFSHFARFINLYRDEKDVNDYITIPNAPAGTFAYIVTKQGAQKLLDQNKKISWHIDFVAYTSNINIYSCKNPLVGHDDGGLVQGVKKTGYGIFDFVDSTGQPVSHYLQQPIFVMGQRKISLESLVILLVIAVGISIWFKSYVPLIFFLIVSIIVFVILIILLRKAKEGFMRLKDFFS